MPAVVSVTVERTAAPRRSPAGASSAAPQGGPTARCSSASWSASSASAACSRSRCRRCREMPRAHADGGGRHRLHLRRSDGYVATNNHVIADADEVTVTMYDGREFPAEVVGVDRDTDLAVLKVDAGEDLPFVEFADSDARPGRRSGDRDRQSVRARQHRHGRHRVGPAPRDRRRSLRRLHADRCADQPRQLGRPDLQPRGQGDRRQHRDPQPDRRQCRHRLRDPGQPRLGDRRRSAGRRPGRARLARRPHPGASTRISRRPSTSTRRRVRWSRRSRRTARRPPPASSRAT